MTVNDETLVRIREYEPGVIITPESTTVHLDRVDDVVDHVVSAKGELTIRLSGRSGAVPYLRPTPYRNHRGVIVDRWSCLSMVPKALPGRTLAFDRFVNILPDERDGYRVNMFTTPWVWNEVYRARIVDVVPTDESPWRRDWYDYDTWTARKEGRRA